MLALQFAFNSLDNEDKDWKTYIVNYYKTINKPFTKNMVKASELIVAKNLKDNDGNSHFTDTQQKRAETMFEAFLHPEQIFKSKKRKRFV